MPGAHPGSTSGSNPGGQGVIPRQFKQKNWVIRTYVHTHGETDQTEVLVEIVI